MTEPIEPHTFRECEGGYEVWDGEKWLSPVLALNELGYSFEDVGELVSWEQLGGGAYGGPGEYTVSWRIWRLGDKWVLDRDDDGLDHIVCDSLEECRDTLESEAEVYFPEDEEE